MVRPVWLLLMPSSVVCLCIHVSCCLVLVFFFLCCRSFQVMILVGKKVMLAVEKTLEAGVIRVSSAGSVTMRALEPACHVNCILLEAINLRIINKMES